MAAKTSFYGSGVNNPAPYVAGTIYDASYGPVITLVDGPTVTLDVSKGFVFALFASGDRQILAPLSSPLGAITKKIIIRHTAVSGNRTLSLQTGVAGGFAFGSDIPTITTTINGTTDFIGCIWNDATQRWDVIAVAKGY